MFMPDQTVASRNTGLSVFSTLFMTGEHQAAQVPDHKLGGCSKVLIKVFVVKNAGLFLCFSPVSLSDGPFPRTPEAE